MTWTSREQFRFAPMLATAAEEPFDSAEHVFEVKWDGIRCLAETENGTARLYTRTGRDITRLFPELGTVATAVAARGAVFDGELCVLHDGKPSFHRVQRRNALGTEEAIRSAAEQHPALYVVFDLLHVDGSDVVELPWERRRRWMETAWRGHDHALLTDAVPVRGRDLYAACLAQGLEGIVAKRVDSPYVPGRRTSHWLKIRQRRELDAVVGGYVPRGRSDFASLALGLYFRAPGAPGPGLRYIGNVGTGFPAPLRRELMAVFKELETTVSPFGAPPIPAGRGAPSPPPPTVPDAPSPKSGVPFPAGLRWLLPLLVARVQYMEFTPGGRLRHPSFVGLRDDKRPEECTDEGLSPDAGDAGGREGWEL